MRRVWLGIFTAAVLLAAGCGSAGGSTPTPLSRAAAGKVFLAAKAQLDTEWINFTKLAEPGSQASLAQLQAEGKRVSAALAAFQHTLLTTPWPQAAAADITCLAASGARFSGDVSSIDSTQPLQGPTPLNMDSGQFFDQMDPVMVDLGLESPPPHIVPATPTA